MSDKFIEHIGIVQGIKDGNLTVAVETSGCKSCGQGGSCGIGKMAAGRPATLLVLPAPAGIKAGDQVVLKVPEGKVNITALLGYLFPAIALLAGAGLGSAIGGSDGATALGAIFGFIGALAVARIAVSILPGILPAPQLITQSTLHQQELSHER